MMPELEELIKQAKAAVDAMSPEELQAMRVAQTESWARGEAELSRQERAPEPPMTLDKFQRDVKVAVGRLRSELMVSIEKAIAAKLDGKLCVAIVEREFEEQLKQ